MLPKFMALSIEVYARADTFANPPFRTHDPTQLVENKHFGPNTDPTHRQLCYTHLSHCRLLLLLLLIIIINWFI